MKRRLRVEKAVALLLCFCTLLICTPYQEVNAKEYGEKYLTIKRVNDGQQDTYKIITDGEEVFINAAQLSELAGFDEADIVRDGDKLTSVTLVKGEEQEYNQDIIISASDNTIYSLKFGEKEFEGYLDAGDDVYLNLVDMFNYLRIKAEAIDDRLFINVPVYTMYDFMTTDYPEVLKNCVSQLDLLEPGEDLKSSGNWDAVYLACNNFDFRFLVPIWGTNKIKDEQYSKAIQTLNEEDETFYDEDTNEYFQSELNERGLGNCLASGQDLIDTLSVGGGPMDSAEDVIKQLEGLSEADQDVLFSLWDTLNWNREDFLKATGLKTFSDHAGEISDALTMAEIAVSAYEAYERASSWSEDCLNDLDVLRNLNENNYGENKDYVKRISKVAEQSYQASSDPEKAAEEQLVSDIADLALEKAITETSVQGKVADLFVFSVNLGISVARCFGNIAEEMDKGELSYMVTCLINIAAASRIDAEVKRDQLDITELNSGNQLEEFRDSMRTAIKSNLRCWRYIYYWNSDGTWENSERGKTVKSQINKMNVYLTLLNETEQYDYALDEYDLITYSPERIVEISGENNEEKSTSVFETMSGQFVFSSGAGGWGTVIDLNSDGSFSGEYHASEYGEQGEGYSNGMTYISEFSGKFSQAEQIDNYIYSIELENFETATTPGDVYYENDTKYVCVEPYGFNGSQEFLIYVPGIAIDELPENFIIWLQGFLDVANTEILPYYGIYNADEGVCFIRYE